MKFPKQFMEIFDGQFEIYSDNFCLKEKTNFKEGYLTGEYIVYDDNEYIIEKHNYIKGDREGISEYFREELLIKQETYKNGIIIIIITNKTIYHQHKFDNLENYLNIRKFLSNPKFGINVKYEPPNNKKVFSYYKGGEIKEEFNGRIYKEFWKTGILKTQLFFKNKSLNGICTFYYPNGIIKERRTYLEGRLNGSFDMFFNSGRIKIRKNYLNFKKVGVYEEFFSNGQIKEKKEFLKGV